MLNMKYFIFSLILKTAIIVFSISGFITVIFESFDKHSLILFTYFTILSNLFILITTINFLVATIKKFLGYPISHQRLFFRIRCFSLIAICITGVVFNLLLVPAGGLDLLHSFQSVCFHIIVPVLSIIDFIIFNTTFKIRVSDIMLSIIYPLVYFGYVMILSYSGVRWSNGAYAPYPFIDYHENTWFGMGERTFGVFYWLIIIIAIYIGLGFLFKLFQYLIKKKHLHRLS